MLPITGFAAIILGYLALRTALSGGRPLLVALLLTCAAQALMMTLAGGYGWESLRQIAPISASLIPPLAWFTFRDAMVSRADITSAWPHLAGPAFILFCRIFAPEVIDIAVPLIFIGYGSAILRQLRHPSGTPLARLDEGVMPAMIWRLVGWALIGSALSDMLIALAYLNGHAGWAGWLITLFSSLVLLLLGLLSVCPAASSPEDEPAAPTETGPSQTDLAEDGEIVARLDAFLRREQAHLDPDLTLSRLARRMHLPEKRLSAAVNRATGQNVSRHVNAWRIAHACELIENGSSITEAMLASGFNTKSNFNREFRRVTGSAPSQWQSQQVRPAGPN